MTESRDPFYVGYLPLPASFRSLVRVFVAISVLGAAAMAFVLASRQRDPGTGQWESTTEFAIEGHLSVDPYPLIYVDDPEAKVGPRAVLLVSALKYGAAERSAPFDGKRVRAKGYFITRDGRGLFELAEGEDAITVLSEESAGPGVEALGEHTLVGEITDSKCFLGVMKPGFGKTHRACAVRCIAGGIPPLFVTRDSQGVPTTYLLTGSEYEAVNEPVLPYVAEPVELRGALERRGDLLVFASDLETVVRK